MITSARYNIELAVLKKYLPENTFVFKDMDTAKPILMMAAKTNSGNVYTLRIELDEFPLSIPKVFVTQMLKSKDGKDLDMPCHEMHTLLAENDMTRICHHGSRAWKPNISLYKVYIKCRLWLEMYELHLETGNDIAYYLKGQF